MTGEEASKYIGMAYRAGADGPDEWDCWHFLQHCMRTYFGKQLPFAPIGDRVGCKAVYDGQVAAGKWRLVSEPQHGDAVRMRDGDWPHVGLYLDIDGGKVLHCCEDFGVIATSPSVLRNMGFGRLKFYRILE
ncbi:hypothetical protein [Pseudomonas virus PBPA162]|uniref:NlpC/P60 domain-containing protein n=3 Tax=Viruses TaxID=10239 RepID=A0A7S5AZN8_9CAUD|nr:minor tail protein [Pseudomonas phage Iggy]YP_010671788.1 hypothetical protein PQC32_gp25 [Pseudomonas virus PBPA162]QDB70859.1 hypothetical protein [Pseudomonas virus PBPA162]QEA09751.1 hypothetical protein [Pseudomonas phage Iggy]WPK40878.1 minor tail protein [Pseudomonas phage Knedl]